jgi:hypothetical protein
LTINQTASVPRGMNVCPTTMLAGNAEIHSRLMLLAPYDAEIPSDFETVDSNARRHEELIAEMQQLRGSVYLEDGAIESWQLSRDGRHQLAIDKHSWHLLSIDPSGNVCGCVRYFSHRNSVNFRDLWVKNSALANSPVWGPAFRSSVEAELRQARKRNVSYVEVGGWAISSDRRHSIEALRTALATYSLAQVLGGCLGIATATVRHHSSSILRRIGGAALGTAGAELPPHFDPQYGCEMEVLRFDSSSPAPRYSSMVSELCSEVLNVPVICKKRPRTVLSGFTVIETAPAQGFNQPVLQSV